MKVLLASALLARLISAQVTLEGDDAANFVDEVLGDYQGDPDFDVVGAPEPKYVDDDDDPFWFNGGLRGTSTRSYYTRSYTRSYSRYTPSASPTYPPTCPSWCHYYCDDDDDDYPISTEPYYPRPAYMTTSTSDYIEPYETDAAGGFQNFEWPTPAKRQATGADYLNQDGGDYLNQAPGEGDWLSQEDDYQRCPRYCCRPRPTSRSYSRSYIRTRTRTRRPRPTATVTETIYTEYPETTFITETSEYTEYPETTFITETSEYTEYPETTFITETSVTIETVTVDPTGPNTDESMTAEPTAPSTVSTSSEPAQNSGTLDNTCPPQCDPSPLLNHCHSSTSCVTSTGVYPSKYYCFCSAGFRANGFNPNDFTRQYRSTNPNTMAHVRVAVGLECTQQCSDNLCSEVIVRNQCD